MPPFPPFIPQRPPLGALGRIYAEEGLRGLYRGLGATVLGYLPTWAIYFTAYDALKKIWADFLHESEDHHEVHILAAMSAGAGASCIINPVWVIKTRMMVCVFLLLFSPPVHITSLFPFLSLHATQTQSKRSPYHYTSVGHALQSILRKEGVWGLYRGFATSLLGVLHVGVQFPLYEQLKMSLAEHQRRTNPSESHLQARYILLASVVSKVVAGVVTYPHEVIRTRLHNQTPSTKKYLGMLHAVNTIVKEEGFRALYHGLGTSILKMTPSGAATLVTYEVIKRNLERHLNTA